MARTTTTSPLVLQMAVNDQNGNMQATRGGRWEGGNGRLGEDFCETLGGGGADAIENFSVENNEV